MHTAPRLETDRLILRPHRRGDFEASAALWADPEVVRHISGTPSRREASWTRLLRYAGHWQMMGFGYWAVERKDGGGFIGEVGLADHQRDMQPPLAGRPEAGWVITPAAHGQGFATEAMRAVMLWADEILTSPEAVCILDPDYAASRRVADKLGFREEAIGQYHGAPTLVMARKARL